MIVLVGKTVSQTLCCICICIQNVLYHIVHLYTQNCISFFFILTIWVQVKSASNPESILMNNDAIRKNVYHPRDASLCTTVISRLNFFTNFKINSIILWHFEKYCIFMLIFSWLSSYFPFLSCLLKLSILLEFKSFEELLLIVLKA